MRCPAGLWCLVLAGCAPWEPVVASVRFSLEGAHLELACAACHPGDSPNSSLVYRACAGLGVLGDQCLDCHSCDRALHPLGEGHWPGRSCGEAGCHTGADLSWGEVGGDPTDPTNPTEPVDVSCATGCHGEVWDDASPRDASHLAHQTGTTLWTGAIECAGCHPADTAGEVALAPSHFDGIVNVLLSGLALGPEGLGVASYTAAGCSGVYCHGSAMEILPDDPVWNGGPAEVACGSCHGWPPAGTHPAIVFCSGCHPPTGGDDQLFDDRSTHIDGVLQY